MAMAMAMEAFNMHQIDKQKNAEKKQKMQK